MKKAVSGRAPYAPMPEREGLDPRAALDILEVRARESEDYIIRNADVGSAVFEYLAEYGAPATRQAVAANPATPARINRLLADDGAAPLPHHLLRRGREHDLQIGRAHV